MPDEAAQEPLLRYLNPRRAEWPEADFVVGNPPFLGAGTMRRSLGDGYAEALRAAWKDVRTRRTSSCSGGSRQRN